MTSTGNEVSISEPGRSIQHSRVRAALNKTHEGREKSAIRVLGEPRLRKNSARRRPTYETASTLTQVAF